jgi:hypothetical protein
MRFHVVHSSFCYFQNYVICFLCRVAFIFLMVRARQGLSTAQTQTPQDEPSFRTALSEGLYAGCLTSPQTEDAMSVGASAYFTIIRQTSSRLSEPSQLQQNLLFRILKKLRSINWETSHYGTVKF